ncbi:hypothetical protein [Vitiosangium sp. GDMCC 1.1324]|uniref:hypothetical protein n=1 Tax=Vitiosangium sp. (strain GDMCC 1.1324) TaxID=2138576 RepID=UPI000D39B277|nr:hypothetical protein [Vitiosangium sp. GDMCC 1.1324]PTL75029.1 hypothetical protein DAT35_56995 [Vitiosangium sp. GDMCC 1.1324]
MSTPHLQDIRRALSRFRVFTPDEEATVVTISSRDMVVKTLSTAIDDAAVARRGAKPAEDRSLRLSMEVTGGGTHAFDFDVYGFAPLYTLSPTRNFAAVFQELFRRQVLAPALAQFYVQSSSDAPSPWRWCFAGVVGDIVSFDSQGRGFLALDPAEVMERLNEEGGTSAIIDIVLGKDLVTAFPAFLTSQQGKTWVSTATDEVGQPICFLPLGVHVAAHWGPHPPDDVAFWRSELRRLFPGAFAE